MVREKLQCIVALWLDLFSSGTDSTGVTCLADRSSVKQRPEYVPLPFAHWVLPRAAIGAVPRSAAFAVAVAAVEVPAGAARTVSGAASASAARCTKIRDFIESSPRSV